MVRGWGCVRGIERGYGLTFRRNDCCAWDEELLHVLCLEGECTELELMAANRGTKARFWGHAPWQNQNLQPSTNPNKCKYTFTQHYTITPPSHSNATSLPGTDMHFHLPPPPRSPAPHKKFSWKIQGPTKRTAMKPHGHFPNIIIIVQRSWCPSQGTGRARATCCRPRPSLSPLSCAQIHLLTLFFFCFCFFCCFVHPQFNKNIFHSMF